MVPLDKLQQTKGKTVGTKQTKKAVENGQAELVFVAQDAESHVSQPLKELCYQKNVEVVEVSSMAELGRACGIDVGSASAAIIRD